MAAKPVRARAARAARRSRAPGGTASWFALLAFGVFCAVLAFIAPPPRWTFAVYLGMSVWAFLAYGADKWAAGRGGWRISERTLHLLALAGGWPGALLAQQMLRHKSSKVAFRRVFWVTVALNVAGLAWLCSPLGAPVRQALQA
ncbi:DUF1294 domain-containing protein [Paracidovorax anthurii]|uniref:DUF1294 domain-containing protein n=1 Tax=Paracidovorax anthurii TaxID=78229 RepID=UPI001FED14C7|nr:DUF1294 domain-containing protein [Paracidovorax anthurii]